MRPTCLVVATHNAKKAGEMVTLLSRGLPGTEILTLADFPGAPEPDETGDTYQANAIIKAESAAAFTGELCVADDAGLEIDVMPGLLGVFSKRFAGEDTTFDQKMDLILSEMADVADEDRRARFVCWVALARNGEPTSTFWATCEGRIARQKSGAGGFGYDPIFWPDGCDCSMADLTADEKHAVSHRGKVLAQLLDHLNS